MKRKILLSPLIIIVLIIVAGVSIAGAAIFIGNTTGDSNSLGVNLQKGLVGWWKMDGNAKDATLYANDGTVTGAVLANDRKGEAQKAYGFNGIADVINLGSSVPSSSSSFSDSVWVNMTSSGTVIRRIIYHSENSVKGYQVVVSTGGVLQGWVLDSTTSTNTVSGGTLTTGVWHNIVQTFDGTTQRLYLDGVLVGTPTTPANFTQDTGNFLVGSTNTGAGGFNFNGQIDDVRIYNRALSAAEITALYGEYDPGIQVSDLQKGLFGWWKMDGNAKDSTLYGDDLANSTGVTFNNDRKGEAQKAANFVAASSQYLDIADNANLSVPSTSFTLTGRFYLDSYSTNYVRLVTKESGTNKEYTVLITASTNGTEPNRPYFIVTNGTTDYNTSPLTASSSQLSLNTWYFFTAWFDIGANTVNFQLNNGTISSVAGPGAGGVNDSNGVFRIGMGSFEALNGRMDDVRLYKRVLSATERTALYESYDPGIQVSTLQKGLVGNWDMNGNAKDKTLYANDGTVTGATLTTDRKGQVNKAYLFDGTTSVINAGAPAILDNMSAFSVSAWINPTSVGENSAGRIVDKASAIGPVNGWNFLVDGATGTKRMRFIVDYDTTNLDARSNDNAITLGAWQHVVVTWTGSATATNVHIYVNGTEVTYATQTNGSTSRITDAGQAVLIGNEIGGARTFDGSIDDVRIYNRALSATEVADLYQSY